jgi:hypothetical protein
MSLPEIKKQFQSTSKCKPFRLIMSSTVLRIGLVSTASIATKNLAAIRAASDRCVFAAVASRFLALSIAFFLPSPCRTHFLVHNCRDLAKAQNWAQRHACSSDVKVYGSYTELIDDPDIDALYVPLPTALHVDVVIQACQAKKPVLLEKPVALSVADLERMLEAAAQNNVFIWDGKFCTCQNHKLFCVLIEFSCNGRRHVCSSCSNGFNARLTRHCHIRTTNQNRVRLFISRR